MASIPFAQISFLLPKNVLLSPRLDFPSYFSFIPFPSLYTYFSSVQSLSSIQLFVTPWTVTRQASLSITNSWNLLELTSIKSVMQLNHLILYRPLLLLLPSIFPSIKVFSNKSVLRIRWPKYWSFSFSLSPSI